MNNLIPILISSSIVIVLSGLFSLYIGRKKKGDEEWAIGGRSLPVYVVVGTQFATAMGGGMLVAHVGIGYSSGWSTITYGLILGSGLLILVLLSRWLREQGFTTLPDVIKKIYGEHPVLTSITAFMTIIVPFGWVATQLVAFGRLLEAITGIEPAILMFFLALVSLIYVLPSGLTSIAWTDFVFGILMLCMSVLSVFYVLNMAGGISEITQSVPETSWKFPEGLGAVGGLSILLWTLSILPGTLTNQMYYQRIYASKDTKGVRISLLSTAIIILLVEVWAATMGMSIHAMNPSLSNPEDAAGWFLTQVPTWFLALYASFIIATIMSTVNSGVQSVVVNLTRDIYKTYINPSVSEKKMLSLSRWLSVAVVAVAYLMATQFSGALNWLVATYAYSAGALLVPIFVGYALRKSTFLTVQGGMASMLLGVLGTGVAHYFDTTIPYVIYGLLFSLAGLIIGSALTQKKDENMKSNGEKKSMVN
ncbi:sodium:proline symporter [[Bacillus] enclensis]|uniref:Solute:Na+ symporter, SSS family n=1 Tax=[Bacillus] enclensis TaxID=1402860 RepID=A0A0V8HHY8_9BACI|nr:sodium:solute symporter family protein [[Bacillus] enclensis]KSU61776.1 sodium:proline symporter [[Bacillus] enclensis]SCC15115.1 solute:Na+ symporter, SSS family [[Bacillus] enclensis]